MKRKINIGVIGRGKWGKRVINVLKNQSKIQFVFGRKSNYRKFNKNIKWVFVLSSNKSHYKICKFYLENKINVFCEKPLTLNYKQSKLVLKIMRQIIVSCVNFQGKCSRNGSIIRFPLCYFHDFLTHSWTTNYADDDTSSMDCEKLRGDVNQPVYHMNNWLKNQAGLSDPNRASEANDVDFMLGSRVALSDAGD